MAGPCDAPSPHRIPMREWLRVLARAGRHVLGDRLQVASAGIAFFAILSVAPMLVTAMSLYAAMNTPEHAREQLSRAARLLPDQLRPVVADQLASIATASTHLLTVRGLSGLLFALWTATTAATYLVDALTLAYSEKETRGFLRRSGVGVVIVLGGALLLGGVIAAASLCSRVLAVLPSAVGTVASVLAWPVLAGVMAAALALLYRFAPDRKSARWRWISGGATLATLLWLGASKALFTYVQHLGDYRPTYGSLAGVAISMFWLWITVFLVLAGAAVNAEAERATSRDSTVGPDRPQGQRGAAVADRTPQGPVPLTAGNAAAGARVRADTHQHRSEEPAVRAAVYTATGDPADVLSVADIDEPHAGPGQIRIAVRAAGVNPIDWKNVAGLTGRAPADRTVPGIDAAGVVDEIGDGVTGVDVGDAVFGHATGGSAAQYAVLTAWAVKPETASFEEAGGLPVAGETAVRVLDLLGLRAGQTVVVDGASGGVGIATVQVALARGLRVIGTAGAANQEFVASLGAVPTPHGPGLADRVRALAPDGVDGGIDTAGRGSVRDLIALTGDPSRVVTIADFGAGELGVHVTTGGGGQAPRLAEIAGLLADGRLSMPIAGTYPLEQIGAAYTESRAGHVRGKLVLLP